MWTKSAQQVYNLVCNDLGDLSDEVALTSEQQVLLDKVDEELFKFGTLNHGSMDWDGANQAATELLKSVKHIQALFVVWNMALRASDEEMVTLAIVSLNEVLQNQWGQIYPPQKKFRRLKLARIKDVLNGSLVAIPKLSFSSEQYEQIKIVLEAIQPMSKELGLDAAKIADAIKRLDAPSDKASSNVSESNAEHSTAVPSNSLDAKSRAELRREIRLVSGKISSYKPDAGVAYLMRGFSAWMELGTPPEADSQGTTSLQPMPSSVVEDYKRDQKNANWAVFMRLEDRLWNSPDWFEGHMIAFGMARKLDLNSAAEAIRTRVANRLESLPSLLDLFYANRTPIVNEEVLAWLSAAQSSFDKTSESSAADGSSEHSNEAEDDSKDIVLVIEQFEDNIKRTTSLRERTQTILFFASQLKDLGYKSMAKGLLKEVGSYFEIEIIQKWEPEMLAEFQKLKSQLD